MTGNEALLKVENLVVGYGRITALHGVSLEIGHGEAVALLGANGAGKSTLIRTVMGLLTPSEGSLRWIGDTLAGMPPEKRARQGIAYVPEGRRVFPGMTVRENLEVACPAGPAERSRKIEETLALFPALRDKFEVLGWKLSGGQQQMLAISRALMSSPRLLLLDEPSLGLSPLLVSEVLNHVRHIVDSGTSVLLAEQNVAKALEVCRRAYVLQVGRLVHEGDSATLARSDDVRRAFLAG